ncbi:MAG TPA: hypothetical protein VK579_17340 [Terriglobales bacterium]|jgi:hypothetical protein|nr:hypothetical protein [Burkholderiales bacterium]HMH08442.1 hypothetical protein [Terriglobales bacterium]
MERVLAVVSGSAGRSERAESSSKLLARFEEVRRAEQLDETAAEMLAEQYI